MSRLARLLVGCCLLLAALAGGTSPASAATCADYSTQAAAQQAADTRDADGDGLFCEALPCPCSSGGGGDSGSSGSSDDGAAAERRRQAAARKQAAERRRQAASRRRAAARRRALARKRAAEHRQRLARHRVERGAWRVRRVVDGDTLRVGRTDGSATETVQLIGVDTREPDECGGPEATALVGAFTFPTPADAAAGTRGALVRLTTDRTQDVRDADGRLLAYVDLIEPDRFDLGLRIIVAGFSEAAVAGVRFARYGAYHEAELEATADGRDWWSTCPDDVTLPATGQTRGLHRAERDRP